MPADRPPDDTPPPEGLGLAAARAVAERLRTEHHETVEAARRVNAAVAVTLRRLRVEGRLP